MRRSLFCGVFLLFSVVSNAQLRYLPIGFYKKETAQGMGIWQDKAYLLNNHGHCRVYDLKMEEVVGEYKLASAGSHNHANSLCFGNEIAEGGDRPVTYITECGGRKRCFVENLNDSCAYLVQTIYATLNGKELQAFLWAVDRQKESLYAVTRDDKHPVDSLGTKRNTIFRFRLPKLSEGKEVVLDETEIVDSFSVFFPNILQGGKVRNGRFYISLGLQESLRHQQNSDRAVVVIDLKKRKIKKIIDINKITINEPEDLDFYKGCILVWCGQEGGLYSVKK